MSRAIVRPWNWESDDLEALTLLLHRAYAGLLRQGLRFTATDQPPEVTRERLQGGEPFALERNGVVLGTVTLSFPIKLWDNDPPYYGRPGVALLSQFGLEPEEQGKGYGRQMFDFAVAWCRVKGASELCLDTSDQALHLIEMYCHWGFRVVERHRYGHVNYESVIMSLRLDEVPYS